jgi:phage terminase large subunit
MLSYKDNPWLPDDLKLECEILRTADEDEWLHVWGGQTRQTLTGAIYAKEIKKVLLEGRRGKVSYDPSRPVHTFWDLGHDDHTSIWFVQQVGVEYNLINYFQDRLQKIPYYIKICQELEYNYGYHHLPHDGENETLASRSTAKFVRDAYPGKVKIIPRVAKKVMGIRAARVVFDLCNFDEENTADGWTCLCRYCYEVNEEGQWKQTPKHDEFSNGADAFQTFALSLKPEQAAKKIKTVTSGRVIQIRSQSGWMR